LAHGRNRIAISTHYSQTAKTHVTADRRTAGKGPNGAGGHGADSPCALDPVVGTDRHQKQKPILTGIDPLFNVCLDGIAPKNPACSGFRYVAKTGIISFIF
jgi:hypothetical protein